MASTNKLDHTVINVRFEMDRAEPLFRDLGFTTTPRGFHSHGSMNHLMMFGTDYLELIGLPPGEEIRREDLRDAPIGINGLVFKSGDVDATFRHLDAAGFAGAEPRAFSRPVDVDGTEKDVHFRTVTCRTDVFPGGRVYFCEHGNPELVWRPEWQSHANGTTHMPEFVAVAGDADAEAANFATLLATDVETDAAGARFAAFDGGRLTVLTPEQYGARYGALASPMNGRAGIFGALVFATGNLAKLNDLLAAAPDGVVAEKSEDRTVVRVEAFDAVLEFVAA